MKRLLPAICMAVVPALAIGGGHVRTAFANEDGPDVATTRACDLGVARTHMRADGTGFATTRQCAQYVDRGGTLYPKLDLRLVTGLDVMVCRPSSVCHGRVTKKVSIVIGHIARSMVIDGTIVDLAGFDFSPSSTVTLHYDLGSGVLSQTLTTQPNGFFSLTGRNHVTAPCGTHGVSFGVTDDATGLTRTVTPELLC